MNIAMEQTEVQSRIAPYNVRRCLARAGASSACIMSHIRIADPQEYVHGQLKNKYGDCFIRGNNGARWMQLMPQLNHYLV